MTARIAQGGMATVHVGTVGGRRVAIKVPHPHLAEDRHVQQMFLHEARLASRLRHDNVVRVLDHGTHPALGTFIVMEYVEGGDLSALLRAASLRTERLSPRVVARVAVDLCRGLHAAHELTTVDGAPLRLIHRDVSPHNVLVGSDGIGRLTDFGIAKSDERYTATRPGELKGKLAYMAPEQLSGAGTLDRRVDVFSAGVVLWEALVTRRLFRGPDEASIIDKVLRAEVAPPSRFYGELAPFDQVIERALAPAPKDRFSTAAELADAIEEAARGMEGLASRAAVGDAVRDLLAEELSQRAARLEPGAARSDPDWMHAMPTESTSEEATMLARGTRRRRLPWMIAGAATLILLGGLGAWLWSTVGEEPAPAASSSERD